MLQSCVFVFVCVFVCMFVCVCVCVCVRVRVYILVLFLYTFAHVVINVYTCICIQSPLRKFTIVHDSQILQSIPNEEYSHAYIHYMTLNDIAARGYVRQFCMSYISRKERYVAIVSVMLRTYVCYVL